MAVDITQSNYRASPQAIDDASRPGAIVAKALKIS